MAGKRSDADKLLSAVRIKKRIHASHADRVSRIRSEQPDPFIVDQ